MRYLPNHKKIMLILTENCNLRCKYCYELDKKRNDMDFAKAKEILRKSLAQMAGYDTAVIELHGGEPFLNFELIKQIDTFVTQNYTFPVLFRTTTNGTRIHGDIQEWLKERKDRYEVMLSLDGKRKDHDLNRVTANGKGSFDLIDIDFFASTWKYCPVSMTVNEDTIENMAENTIWIQEKGMECLNAFQWATDWNIEKTYPLLKRELKKLVDYYSDHPEMHVCLLMNYQLLDFNLEIAEDYRYCVEIDDPIECYDANGRYAPCHGFTEFTVGNQEISRKFSEMSINDFALEPRNMCYGCKLVRLCRICFAANYMLTGDMQKQSKAICLYNQLCILAGLQVELNRSKRYTNRRLSKEYLDTIIKVQRYIDERRELDITHDYFTR